MNIGSILNRVEDEEDRKDTWKGTDYNASDEEAHRDVRYSVPSWAKQTLTVFMVQMKLFSKARWTFVTLFTALLIPILVIGAEDTISFLLSSFWFTTNSNTYIAGLLAFLPMFLGEATLGLLGARITGSAGMAMISEMDLTNLLPMEIVGVVWGIAFLIIGLIKTQRREM